MQISSEYIQRGWQALQRRFAPAFGNGVRSATLIILCIVAVSTVYHVLFASAAPPGAATYGTIRRDSGPAREEPGVVPADLHAASVAAERPVGVQSAASRQRLAGAAALAVAILALAAGFGWLRRRHSSELIVARLAAQFPEIRQLGLLPTVPARHMRACVGGTVDTGPFANALGEIGSTLQKDSMRRCCVIVIAAPRCGAGKTTLAVNLAGWLARAARVMLVDGDLRTAGLSRGLGLPRYDAGLNELIARSATYRSSLVQTATPNLHAIRSGALPNRPEDVLASPRMAHTLRLAKRYYDRIVIDSPGILEHPDAAILAGYADGVVLVADARFGRLRDMVAAVELLKSINANILGIVLNYSSR